MEDHKLAVPLCALEVASSQLTENGSNKDAAPRGSSKSALGKQQTIAFAPGACSHPVTPDVQAACISPSGLPAVSPPAELRLETSTKQRKDATSVAGTRRNSSAVQDGIPNSTSPDGSYISSPFFSGSPMDFSETLQPRALNVASDMQCSLATPLEKFFDALDSADIPVATPSPLATVCTHHTTSPAAEAFPLNGSGTQDGEEVEKTRVLGRLPRLSTSESLNGGSAFPIRPTESAPQKGIREQQNRAVPTGRQRGSHGEKVCRITPSTGSTHAGPSQEGVSPEFVHSKPAGSALDQQKHVPGDDAAASEADRLLVDFQLLLILLFDQVCNVVPGLRRQDGGAFYSMHLQRIAAGPLHPTLASYADVLLPICSAMNFFSSGSGNGHTSGKQEEQESILSVALRYLARHGTVPAAPIAEMVAKCPASVFIQVVSALECMYSLQRILAPGSPEPRVKASEELDPKTIWGDAVADMEKAASVLAEECVSSSLPQKSVGSGEAISRTSSPPLVQPSQHPKRPRAAGEAIPHRRQKPAVTPMVAPQTDSENRGPLASPALGEAFLGDSTVTVAPALPLQNGQPSGGGVVDARGEVSPAFIPASVNKRRHPNVQAEILNSCCPERLARRGTRLLGEVLQKLQCEQAMRPAATKTNSPKQAFSAPVDQLDAPTRQPDATACAAGVVEGESDSVSAGSARGKRKMSTASEQALGEALAQLAAIQQVTASSSSTTPGNEDNQADATDAQLKKHGYGLRKGVAKKGKKSFDEGPPKGRARLTPVKAQNPQQSRVKTAAPLSPSDTSPHDPSTSSLPPSLTEQLMKLASGAEGDFPAALSSTMRGVFFNRSLNRWVCTWSRNGKEYQRSWSAGKYGYETARGLAMHCRLEKLLSGEAHTLQKGMLAVFKPIMNSQVSPASVESAGSTTKLDSGPSEEAERRCSDAQRLRSSPRPANRSDGAVDTELVTVKPEVTQEAPAVPRIQGGSTYNDMLTLMSQAISRKPGAFTVDGQATDAAAKNGDSRDGDEIKELADPSVGEHFLAAVAAAAAVCDVPGFED